MRLKIVKMATGYAVRIESLLRDYSYIDCKNWAGQWDTINAYKYCIFSTLEEAVNCYDTLNNPGIVVDESLIIKARNGYK